MTAVYKEIVYAEKDVDETDALIQLDQLQELIASWPDKGHVSIEEFRRTQAKLIVIRKGLGPVTYTALWQAAQAGDPEYAFLLRQERERLFHREHTRSRKKYHSGYRAKPENKAKAKEAKARWKERQEGKPKVPNQDAVNAAAVLEEIDK